MSKILFDTEDDSVKHDESFTPEGPNRWTSWRLYSKLQKVSKNLVAMGGWFPPPLIGLCEVENAEVLKQLIYRTNLKEAGYRYIHFESPDRRGIDVAALYRPEWFQLLDAYPIRVNFVDSRPTRDILYVKGLLPNRDTLHYFVNHWPSKYGGQFVTEPKRAFVGRLLRQHVDSLYRQHANPLIVITGDFNDEPEDVSITQALGAAPPEEAATAKLINLMWPYRNTSGTHSFQQHWSIIDQFIVSPALYAETSTARTRTQRVQIYNAPWLITKSAVGVDLTFRTYQGPKYIGGYSDHLPILLDLEMEGSVEPFEEDEY